MKQFCVVLTSIKKIEVVKPAPSKGDLETLTDDSYDKQVSIRSWGNHLDVSYFQILSYGLNLCSITNSPSELVTVQVFKLMPGFKTCYLEIWHLAVMNILSWRNLRNSRCRKGSLISPSTLMQVIKLTWKGPSLCPSLDQEEKLTLISVDGGPKEESKQTNAQALLSLP